MSGLPSSRFRPVQAGLVIATVTWLATAGIARAEICHTEGAAQFFDAIHYCVSSVLPASSKWSYGPDHLVSQNDGRLAWCENAPGNGIGETVTVRIDGGIPYRRFWIGNGYGKTQKSYFENARPHKVRITTDRGVDTTIVLPDQSEVLPYYLPEPWAERWLRLEILSVYTGSKYKDTCLDYIAPDLEYEEELLQQQQAAGEKPAKRKKPRKKKRIEPEDDLTELPPLTAGTPAASPTAPSATQDDPFGDLGFPDDSDLDLD